MKTGSKGKDWITKWSDFDDLFHTTIAEASGNRRLALDISRYRLLHKGFNRHATEPSSLEQALREHLSILDALEAKDGELARQRMVSHITAWQEYFIRAIPAASANLSSSVNAKS